MAIKIIKLGAKLEPVFKKVCFKCGTSFSYQTPDIEFDTREKESLIRCPNDNCKALITHIAVK